MDFVSEVMKAIKFMPKEIKDHIYSFNVEHRLHTQQLCIEIKAASKNRLRPFIFDEFICDECGRECDSNIPEDVRLYRLRKILGVKNIFCCGWCEMEFEDNCRDSWRLHRWNTNYKTRIKKIIETNENASLNYVQ